METSCKTCIHEEVCSLWRREECQDASCFQLDGCDYYREAAAKWIPVTERLPEKHEWVLVCSRLVKMRTDFISNDGHWYATPDVTHWMPLPEPPKEAVK